MERIDFHGGFFNLPPKPSGKKRESKKSEKSRKNFLSFVSIETETGRELSETSALESSPLDRGDLEELLDRVHERGEKLKEAPSLDIIGQYREAVRDFLRMVIKSCYQVEERAGAKNFLRQKTFTQIRIVDDKLEHLAAGVMSSQRDQMEILRRVDEIHGILIDLLS